MVPKCERGVPRGAGSRPVLINTPFLGCPAAINYLGTYRAACLPTVALPRTHRPHARGAIVVCKWWGFPKVANHFLEVTGPRVFETSVSWGFLRATTQFTLGLCM